jgi:hypothetical protein
MLHAQRLSTKNSIAFIERAYRKKDPKYADFSTLQQQRLLVRLDEEWTKSECREPPPAPDRKPWRLPSLKNLFEARRGVRKCDMIQRQMRATHDSVAFIEKTYREKDPEYADFSIQQQQEDLRKLNEEWALFECEEPSQKSDKKAGK